MNQPQILIVDDEPVIGQVMERAFAHGGFLAHVVSSGEAALKSLSERHFDFVILDINLPGIPGDQVCREIRKDPQLQTLGVLMITGKNTHGMPTNCLEGGADDYVIKPFDIHELVARVKAILRRPRTFLQDDAVVNRGKIQVDRSARRILIESRPLEGLTPKEFDLLSQLVLHSPRVLDKNTLALKVWGTTLEHLHERTMDVHIRRIRWKLGPFGKCLKTLQTIGYQWLET